MAGFCPVLPNGPIGIPEGAFTLDFANGYNTQANGLPPQPVNGPGGAYLHQGAPPGGYPQNNLPVIMSSEMAQAVGMIPYENQPPPAPTIEQIQQQMRQQMLEAMKPRLVIERMPNADPPRDPPNKHRPFPHMTTWDRLKKFCKPVQPLNIPEFEGSCVNITHEKMCECDDPKSKFRTTPAAPSKMKLYDCDYYCTCSRCNFSPPTAGGDIIDEEECMCSVSECTINEQPVRTINPVASMMTEKPKKRLRKKKLAKGKKVVVLLK